jgi:NTP pyrophosphatase (non-canonical NTP hydrolase)
MPTLEEAKSKVEQLVRQKGFANTKEAIPRKLLFAFVELGEASNAWKKGLDSQIVIEELVDAIFYIVDVARLIDSGVNLDDIFEKKLQTNLSRPLRYGENFD